MKRVREEHVGDLRDLYETDLDGPVLRVMEDAPLGAHLAFDTKGFPYWARSAPQVEEAPPRRPRFADLPALVSERQAAKVLGVSRTRTLGPAIASGAVRGVAVNGTRRIPKAELERVALEGITAPPRGVSSGRKRTRAPRASEVAARIAAIDLDDL